MDDDFNNNQEEINLINIILIVIIFAIASILGYICVYFLFQYPKQQVKQKKENIKKQVLSKIIYTKKIIQNNPKQGKKYYILFKTYHSKLYLYNHNKIALSYLRKAAYDKYLQAEIAYVKYLSVSQHISKIYSINKYNSYGIKSGKIFEYATMIAFIETAAKQGYKPFKIQLALLYLYGAHTIHYESGVNIRLHLQNKQKGKKMLYDLAVAKYKPAMIMINKLYNKKI